MAAATGRTAVQRTTPGLRPSNRASLSSMARVACQLTSSRARRAEGPGRSAGSSRHANTSPTAITDTLTRNSQRQLSQLGIPRRSPCDHPVEDRPERQRQTDCGDQAGAGVPARGLHAEGLHQREDQPGGEAPLTGDTAPAAQ